ncbi:LA_0442/LA_0875 N-terminal domain-containing protein [Leptospira sp. GIMC2001]|uniref:LA_0442/LA_0875 N-terminal domain-containing protein n=1 Tax=Leptospira sp. GIMC2001 TaxID=1513297 RepID=UPI002349A764|nr:DUF5683 domain-containing protein [Leptospira sp. GIMC2001]WCL49717.1 DUF5683 domain-containing protein [Leptospira sp. GIMC2001]
MTNRTKLKHNLGMDFFKLSLLIFLIFANSIFAETILYKDGSKIQGKVTAQNKNSISVKTKDGNLLEISKDSILKVVYKDRISDIEEAKIRENEKKAELAREEKLRIQEEERIKKLEAKQLEEAKTQESKNNQIQEPPKEIAISQSPTAFGAFWRSLLVPGWGQFYQGRKVAGIIYPSLILGGGYAAYEKNRIYRNALRDYNNINNPYTESALIASSLGLSSTSSSPDSTINFSGSTEDIIRNYYNSNESPIVKQKEAVDRHYLEYRTISYVVVALWLWNACDAFIFHPKSQGISGLDSDDSTPKAGDIKFQMNSINVRDNLHSFSTEHRFYLETYF